MRVSELIDGIDGIAVRAATGPSPDIRALTADSRDIAPGFLFAAIPGTELDGARFIPDAITAGASAVLCRADVATVVPDHVACLTCDNPRAALSHLAAKLYPGQPEVICAVTGTNGKTSVASFLRQMWARGGQNAASLGTLGIVTGAGTRPLGHTTPDPVTMHRALDRLAGEGITHAALEASSHGLAQHRLDAVQVAAGAFTNLTRDHMDYHDSFEDYLAAKLRLFTHVVAKNGAAVINSDMECAEEVVAAARGRGLDVLTVGREGGFARVLDIKPAPGGMTVAVDIGGRQHKIHIPLVGDFQAFNALTAAALAHATGSSIDDVLAAASALVGAEGRMQLVAETSHGAHVYVDYAHTPDALQRALVAIRPHTEGRLAVVFGAGGDRDKGKRPLMGRIAQGHADLIIITDDNPRNEDPAAIREEIAAAAPSALNIGDRREAIAAALTELGAGDTLIVAGKGHESGQTAQGVTTPFKDADVIADLLGGSA